MAVSLASRAKVSCGCGRKAHPRESLFALAIYFWSRGKPDLSAHQIAMPSGEYWIQTSESSLFALGCEWMRPGIRLLRLDATWGLGLAVYALRLASNLSG